ncbi:MAG: hypothetical protein JNL82_41845 [Myxococcales bacterium]|nr:hypothetical protein [Myxococcales bacterium]
MLWSLGSPPAPRLLALLALLASPVPVACFGHVELEACTFTDPTYCEDTPAGSSGATGTATSDAEPATSGTSDTGAAADGGAGVTDTGGDTAGGEDTGGLTALPIDPPPTVSGLVCDPEIAYEPGPYQCTYQVSADAVVADLLDDGVVVATVPAGAPLIFPITSAPLNNPGSELTVVVRDAADQTAQTSLYHPAVLLDPGSKVWTTQEPNDGMTSIARGVALQDGYVTTAGSHWSNDKLVGTLRRYDKAGQYIASAEGWTRTHTDWTARPELKTAALTLMGVAVDAEQNIITVGTAYINDEPRMYVARFDADGTLDWEVLGEVPTEARSVGVQPDGTIWVAGDVRTDDTPERWDLAVWVYGPDKQAHGQDIYKDPLDTLNDRSERGHAVAVLPGDRVVVAGTRELLVGDQQSFIPRGVALLYEGKGKRIREWTSPGDKLFRDEIFAAVASDTGVAFCGYAQPPPLDPDQRPQILVRWHDAELAEEKAPRLEVTPGGGVCNAVGYNREGATIVGASVSVLGQGNNQRIFAVRDAALPLVDYMQRDGQDSGDDRVLALACDYMCAWAGFEEVGSAVKWIAGLIRG